MSNELDEQLNITPEQDLPMDYQHEEPSLIPEHKKPKIIEIVTGSSVFKYFLGALIIFGICFISCLFTFNIVLTESSVHGYSMLPTINQSAEGNDGDKKTDSVYYVKPNELKYKDVVIVEGTSVGSSEKIIKRIIALPGQTITFKKTNEAIKSTDVYIYYDVYIDGVKLEESYIYEQNSSLLYIKLISEQYQYYNNLVSALKLQGEYSTTLEKDQYFVMGDNRNHSTDSRYFGPVNKDIIIGKVVLQVNYGESLIEAIWSTLFNTNINKIYA